MYFSLEIIVNQISIWTIYHCFASGVMCVLAFMVMYILSLSPLFSFVVSYCFLLLFSEVRVEGLETLDYLDNLKDKQRFTEQGDAITFESEVSILFC